LSDTEHEPDEAVETGDEEPAEPAQEPQADEEEAEEEEEAAEPSEEETEAPEAAGMSEKEMEASRKKLDNENTRHANRISEIVGEEANLLVPCELCNGFADGYRFPVTPPPEIIERVRVAIGLPDLSNFQQAKHARMCDDCAGLGVVLSGSQVAENAAIRCIGCNGSGYIVISRTTGEVLAPVTENGQATQELPAGVNPDDPAVAELRARGYSVFPPVQIPSGP
jgi:hypothetical protein